MGRRHKKKSHKKRKIIKKETQPLFMDQLKADIDKGDWKKAETLLKKKIEENPTEFLHYLLGYVYRCASSSENNRLDDALHQQEISLELCEDENKAGWRFYEIGKIYIDYNFKNRSKEKALEYFKKAVDCESTCSDAYSEITYLLGPDKIDDRIDIYKRGIKKFPKERRFYLNCASTLSQKKDYSQAEKILLDAIENENESASLYHTLGDVKAKQEAFEEAIHYYKKLLTLSDISGLHARTNFIISTIYLRLDEYDLAEKYLLKSLNVCDDEDIRNSIYFGLILCYLRTNRENQAFELLRKFDFNRKDEEYFHFCGRGNLELGVEEYFLDDGPEHITYTDIIIEAVKLLEDHRDDFDNELSHVYFLLKALILENERKFEECLMYLRTAIGASESRLLCDAFQNVFEQMLYTEDGEEYIKGRALTKYFKVFIETIEDFPVLAPILGGSVRNELVELLFKANKYKNVVNISELFGHDDLSGMLFEAAYSYNEIDDQEVAKILYEKLLEENPESNAVLNNLGNIYKTEGLIEEAINLYEKAVEVDPDDTIAKKNLQIILDQRDDQLKGERQERKKQEREAQHQKVATVHWPSLDFYKKKMLMVLNTIECFSGFDELASLCNIDERWVKRHYNKLVDLGMVVEKEGSFQINPEIVPLIERENSHSVAINIVRADSSINFKPIFNSKLEFNIYRLMIGLFPNHLVFPNMSLQSIFAYDRMKEVLDSDHFKYYLLASVDICVVSTANYLPILGYEVDSPYHDNPDQIERDEKKNEIFEVGGIPMIRLRPHGQPDDMEIRETIINSTQELGKILDPLEKRNEKIFKLLKNFE